MSTQESRQNFLDGGRGWVATVFRAHRKAIPPANVLDEICDKLNKARLISETREIYLAYGINMMPKKEKDPPCIKLYDVIRQALSRPGNKTETFCTGILQNLDCGLAECQALILVPCCDLAQQIAEVMRKLGDNVGVKVHVCMGGEKHNLPKGGCHVIVGTPGCLCTVLNRKLLQPDHIKMFVLDEADEMLWLGLGNQIKEIFQLLPSRVQLALFSYIVHPKELTILSNLMLEPVSLLSESHEVVSREEGIKKFYVNAPEERTLKFGTLCHICGALGIGRCVIYANTLLEVLALSSRMTSRGYKVTGACTGLDHYMGKGYIDREIELFRSGSYNVLVTMPDFMVRAIDLQQVSHVINYDIPPPSNNYHSLWRGGQFGRDGVVIDFVMMEDICGFYDVVIVEGAGLRC